MMDLVSSINECAKYLYFLEFSKQSSGLSPYFYAYWIGRSQVIADTHGYIPVARRRLPAADGLR